MPRYVTPAGAQADTEARERAQAIASRSASGIPVELIALEGAARHVDLLVLGHGAVAEGYEIVVRLAADDAHIDAPRRGRVPIDPRLGTEAD
jgi:hypothetical protein